MGVATINANCPLCLKKAAPKAVFFLLVISFALACAVTYSWVSGALKSSAKLSHNQTQDTDVYTVDSAEIDVQNEEESGGGEGDAESESETDIRSSNEKKDIASSRDNSIGSRESNSSSLPTSSAEIVLPSIEIAPVLTIHQRQDAFHGEREYSFDRIEDSTTSLSQRKDASSMDLSTQLTYVPPSNPNLNRTVMGFAPYWTLYNYNEFQMERLSVIAYFSVAVYPDGNFVTTCNGSYCGDKYGWDGWNSPELAAMVAKAHQHGVKVVLTIKNFDKPSIENLVTSPVAQSTLIANIINEINAKNVDGVNIDYEYIGTASSGLRAAFAASMDAIADAVHAARPGSHVSTDILGSSAMSQLIYDVTALGQTSLDAIMVMSYDFHTTTYYAGKFAAPTSPLYGDQYWYTVSEAMRDISARAPAGKVIMGVPYYGLEFPVSGATWPNKNASVIASGAIATYSQVTDPKWDINYHNDSTIQWDEGEKMTWYKYVWYGWPIPNPLPPPQYWQGYYDDARSLRAKYDYVVQNGLAGVGIWALGYDAGRTELWDVLRDVFSKESIVVLFKDGISLAQQQSIHTSLSAEYVRQLSSGNGAIVRPTLVTSLQLIGQYNARAEVLKAGFLPNRSLPLNLYETLGENAATEINVSVEEVIEP